MAYKNNLSFIKQNPIKPILEKVGGNIYTKCYTPSPDTTRSLAAIFSGKPPALNGCNTKTRFAKYFLDPNQRSIFSLLIEKGFSINLFHEPNELNQGLFPECVYHHAKIHPTYNLPSFLKSTTIKNNSATFIGISDFHQVFNDYGYNERGARKATIETSKTLEFLFSNIDINEFDHAFIFSDHGFRLSGELVDPLVYLGPSRTQTLMLYRQKGQDKLVKNSKFCSVMSILPTLNNIFDQDEITYDYSLLQSKMRDYIIIEDHFNYQPRVRHNIELWGVITPYEFYVKTLEASSYMKLENGLIEHISRPDFDKILSKETEIDIYMQDFDAVQRYKKFMRSESIREISHLSTGKPRHRSNKNKVSSFINSKFKSIF